MYKEHYEDMFKKGIFRDIIVLDAIHENSDININIKFMFNPPATKLLGNNLWRLNIPIIHIIIDASRVFVCCIMQQE